MVLSSRVDSSPRLRIRNGRIPEALRAVFLIAALLLAQSLSAQPANTILLERWDGISGTTVSSLTGNANYPNSPATRTYPTLYETPTNAADNYGTRTRGYVTAPTTGNYIFWIAGDDNCELWLGTNDNPSTIRQIASVPEWTNSREWGKFAQQQSAAIALTAGTRYYIETRHKEGSGGDNLAVGWQLPSGTQERPIPGSRLAPFLLGTPPVITTQPVNTTVQIGAQANFSIVASGTAPLAYQWIRGTSDIPGATGQTYSILSATSADNGAVFSCRVSNAFGTVTSAGATLTAILFPSIVTNIQDQSAAVGQTVVFSVVAAGTGPLEYEFQKNGTTVYRGPSASYTTPSLSIADNSTQWRVIVRNSYGSITGPSVTLTVANPPSIVTHPASQSIAVGSPVTFSVTAMGSAPLAYQWRLNGNDVVGAVSNTLSFPAVTSADNGSVFTCRVSNTAGSVVSSGATLTILSPPVITAHPAPRAVGPGQTATFTVTAGGSSPLTYQWRKDTVDIPGATLASYTTPPAALADNGAMFSVTVRNAAGSVTSNGALLTVGGTSAAYPFNEGFESGGFASYWSFYKSTALGRTFVTGTDAPYAGVFHAQMDVNSQNSSYNLNEMILTVDLAGRSNVELSFYHKITGDEGEILPATFSGHYNGDGVAVSVNGVNWHKAVGTASSEGAGSAYRLFRVNLDAVAAAAGISFTSAFQIKFQQYDDYASPTDGHFFDNIRLDAPLPNQPPTVTITSPLNGSVYNAPATIYIYPNALDPDGSVSKVEFYRGGTTLIGTSTTSPFSFAWSGSPVGAHSLTAKAFDNLNLTATSAAVNITVNEAAPYVTATASPSSGGAPLNVNFTATNSGGTVTAWLWNFGGGATSAIQNPVHTFTSVGSHAVTVTATGPGGSSNYNLIVNVIAPPSVTINATPISGTRPLNVSFSAANTGGSISSYAWAFGNGGTSSSSNPVYTYATAGTFTATLTATNAGGTSTASRIITVNPIVYTLTTCVNGSGTIDPPAGTTQVAEGQLLPITASPAAGHQFERWRVVSGSAMIANPALPATSLTLSSNASVCADFHPDPVTLTLVHTGNGSTTPIATAQVIPGRSFDIGAVPAAGFKFLGWTVPSGDAVVANPGLPATRLTLTSASTVQAEFIPETATPANKKLAISGELSDSSGNRVGYPNPEIVDMSVRLWTALSGGAAVYTETFLAANAQGVSVEDGFFAARLGEGATTGNLQQTVTAHPQLWVEVTIESETPDVLAPRTPLTASAYALGGVPTLVPAAGAVMHGAGDPNVIKANAAIGSYFVNDNDDSTWLKISSGWSRIP